MAKKNVDQPDTQQGDRDRDVTDTRDPAGAGRGADDVRGIADEDEDEAFDDDDSDDMDEDEEDRDDDE